jgi:hypothetical protein
MHVIAPWCFVHILEDISSASAPVTPLLTFALKRAFAVSNDFDARGPPAAGEPRTSHAAINFQPAPDLAYTSGFMLCPAVASADSLSQSTRMAGKPLVFIVCT